MGVGCWFVWERELPGFGAPVMTNTITDKLEHFRDILHKTVLTPGPLLLSLFAVLLLIQA
jgi:hypothetical protein